MALSDHILKDKQFLYNYSEAEQPIRRIQIPAKMSNPFLETDF